MKRRVAFLVFAVLVVAVLVAFTALAGFLVDWL